MGLKSQCIVDYDDLIMEQEADIKWIEDWKEFIKKKR